MTYRALLPDNCPPDAAEEIDAPRVVYRLVRNNSPTDDYFRSQRAERSDRIFRYDHDFAVNRFLELCDDAEVLGTHYVEQFLRYGVQTHFDELKPVLSRMLASDDDVAKVGARQSCVASLTTEEALPLGRQCASGSKPLRLGAAEVYAANLKASALRAASD